MPSARLRHLDHALVIGGTGMLRGVSLDLARRFEMVTVIARTSMSLDALRTDADDPQRLNPLRVDWHDVGFVERRLNDALDAHGPVSLVVCWCHTTAPETPPAIAARVADWRDPVRFVHLLGSSPPDRNPIKARWRDAIGVMPGIEYSMIHLGCERLGNTCRWLPHDRICDAVMQVIDSGEPFTFVGDPIP